MSIDTIFAITISVGLLWLILWISWADISKFFITLILRIEDVPVGYIIEENGNKEYRWGRLESNGEYLYYIYPYTSLKETIYAAIENNKKRKEVVNSYKWTRIN